MTNMLPFVAGPLRGGGLTARDNNHLTTVRQLLVRNEPRDAALTDGMCETIPRAVAEAPTQPRYARQCRPRTRSARRCVRPGHLVLQERQAVRHRRTARDVQHHVSSALGHDGTVAAHAECR